MKKRLLMPVFASFLLLAACASDEETSNIQKGEASVNEQSLETKEAETEPKSEPEPEPEPKQEEPVVAVNYARNYLEDVPYFTEQTLELDKISYEFINSNPDIFPAVTDEAINKVKKLADEEITSKHLNKNVTPYLNKIVSFAGDIIQIEEGTWEDGTTYSIILIEDMDFNAIYAIGYQKTEFLEGDFVEFWGLPMGPYNYTNVDGGITLSQTIALSHIE